MANSKSNIYPIQLQGAELNLNKLDAEIKQYSGFNKNNSPFVGGCLSNVFHKEEQITGGNAENTYIDTNGDVYEVTDHALLKNGGQVLSFQEDKYFVQNELKFNDNPVKVISDKLYVIEEVNTDGSHSYYLKSKEGVFTVGENEVEKLLITTAPEGTTEDFINNITKNCITAIFVTKEDKVYCFVIGIASMVGSSVGVNNLWCIDIDTQESFSVTVLLGVSLKTPYLLYPVSLCYDETLSQISYFYENDAQGYESFLTFYSIDYVNKSFSYVARGDSLNQSIAGSGNKLISTDLGSYCCLNYPYNKLVIAAGSLFTPVTDSTSFKCVVSLDTPYYDNGIKFRNVNICNYYQGIKTIANEVTRGQLTDNGTIAQFLIAYDSQCAASLSQSSFDSYYVVHSTPEKNYIWGFDTFDFTLLNGNNIKRYKYTLGDFVSLGTVFKLAVNNNQLSAICGNNVLLTEWNSVDVKTLMFYSDLRDAKKINTNYDERIYYKSNGKFYEIRLAETPKLQTFGNQLIVNVDSMNNSFDVKRQLGLHFASNLNSIDLESFYSTLTPLSLKSKTPTPDSNYLGFSVNEYRQEDNSSIILNPVPVDSSYNKLFFYALPNSMDVVNLYQGNSASIKYVGSTYKTSGEGKQRFYNSELAGLPSPIDTNGNVEYNVNLFSKIKSVYGNYAFVSSGLNSYPLVVGNNNNVLMNYYLASGIENLKEMFIIQGQFYGIIGNNLFSLSFNNGVVGGVQFIVDVSNLQFVGNTPYEALFFSKTNRCLYSFTGANVLNQKQLVDKISEVRNYLYNPATQTVFLITDIGVLFYGLFGMFLLEYTDLTNIFLLDNGIVMSDNNGNYRYIKYYLDEGDEGYTKENIRLETCFYGMNNEVVTINDCLYFRLFSEEHEEGNLKVKATTISLKGRQTEETTFKIKASDWDKITHTIYLRYQPKTQRGLGVSFSIDSPFKIASMSVGSQPDAVLVDRVSKGAITAPSVTTNNNEW